LVASTEAPYVIDANRPPTACDTSRKLQFTWPAKTSLRLRPDPSGKGITVLPLWSTMKMKIESFGMVYSQKKMLTMVKSQWAVRLPPKEGVVDSLTVDELSEKHIATSFRQFPNPTLW
jgi:hypothetical protein